MIHPELPGVKKADIKANIAKKFKASEDRIAVFGVKAKFGGGRSSGFVTVYDDVDARKKYDTKTNLVRVSRFTTLPNALEPPATVCCRVIVQMARLYSSLFDWKIKLYTL